MTNDIFASVAPQDNRDYATKVLSALSNLAPRDQTAVNPATTAAMATSRDTITKLLNKQMSRLDSPFQGMQDVATAGIAALQSRTPPQVTLEGLDQNRIGKASQIANTLSQVASREANVGQRNAITPYQSAQMAMSQLRFLSQRGDKDAQIAERTIDNIRTSLDPEDAVGFVVDSHAALQDAQRRMGRALSGNEAASVVTEVAKNGRYRPRQANLQMQINPVTGDKEVFNPKTGSTGQPAIDERNRRPGYDNNIGNMRPGPAWEGRTGPTTTGSGQFETFDNPVAGVRANAMNVMTQVGRLGKERATLDNLATIWAPSGDGNDPSAWAASVGKIAGLEPGKAIDTSDPVVMARLMKAINIHEKGRQTVSDEQIAAGVRAAMSSRQQEKVPLPPMAQGIPSTVAAQSVKALPETANRLDAILRARNSATSVPNALGFQGALIDNIGGIIQQAERAIGAPGALGSERMGVNEVSQARDTFNLLFGKMLPTITGDASGRYSNFDVQLAQKMSRFKSSFSSVEQSIGFLTLLRDMEIRAMRRQLSMAGPGGRAIYETFSPDIKDAMESPAVIGPDGEAPYDDIKIEGTKAFVRMKGTKQWYEVTK